MSEKTLLALESLASTPDDVYLVRYNGSTGEMPVIASGKLEIETDDSRYYAGGTEVLLAYHVDQFRRIIYEREG